MRNCAHDGLNHRINVKLAHEEPRARIVDLTFLLSRIDSKNLNLLSYAKFQCYPLKKTIDIIEHGISLMYFEINGTGIGNILWMYAEIGLLPNIKVFESIHENIIKIDNYVSSKDISKY